MRAYILKRRHCFSRSTSARSSEGQPCRGAVIWRRCPAGLGWRLRPRASSEGPGSSPSPLSAQRWTEARVHRNHCTGSPSPLAPSSGSPICSRQYPLIRARTRTPATTDSPANAGRMPTRPTASCWSGRPTRCAHRHSCVDAAEVYRHSPAHTGFLDTATACQLQKEHQMICGSRIAAWDVPRRRSSTSQHQITSSPRKLLPNTLRGGTMAGARRTLLPPRGGCWKKR